MIVVIEMNELYLVTIVSKLTREAAIWSVEARSKDDAAKKVIAAVSVGRQRGMWEVDKDWRGNRKIAKATPDPQQLVKFDC